MPRHLAIAAAIAIGVWLLPASAGAGEGPGVDAQPAAAMDALIEAVTAEFEAADPTHESAGAMRAREMSVALRTLVADSRSSLAASDPRAYRAAADEADRLVAVLEPTSSRLRTWPLPRRVDTIAGDLQGALSKAGVDLAPPSSAYDAIDALLTDAQSPAGGSDLALASAVAAYATFATGPGVRVRAQNPALYVATVDDFWARDADGPGLVTALSGPAPFVADVEAAAEGVRENVDAAATTLGDESISRTTVIVNAALIVFREGLEAVLILAAITASFVGARRGLRRPVLIGGLLGLGASAVTYLLAGTLVDALGDGGLRLQAITGIVAIVVLLVVTNWFFHRVYWSEWISRFNRRRRSLERIDKLGFISGQLVGLVLLGISSVYREGFETVLFLQNLRVSAGAGATALGVGIGLLATGAVGMITFGLERKLPYRKMLIATGVLIGLVLAVMVGTTVHNLQGLGWLPATPTGFTLQPWWGQWLGVFATWEGIGAQIGALLVVYGSYALARELQVRRRSRGRVATVPDGAAETITAR